MAKTKCIHCEREAKVVINNFDPHCGRCHNCIHCGSNFDNYLYDGEPEKLYCGRCKLEVEENALRIEIDDIIAKSAELNEKKKRLTIFKACLIQKGEI